MPREARPGGGGGPSTHRLVLILQAAGGDVRHGAAGLEEAAPPPCPGSRSGTSGPRGSGLLPGPAACPRPGSASAAPHALRLHPPACPAARRGGDTPLPSSLIGCEPREACPPLVPSRSSPERPTPIGSSAPPPPLPYWPPRAAPLAVNPPCAPPASHWPSAAPAPPFPRGPAPSAAILKPAALREPRPAPPWRWGGGGRRRCAGTRSPCPPPACRAPASSATASRPACAPTSSCAPTSACASAAPWPRRPPASWPRGRRRPRPRHREGRGGQVRGRGGRWAPPQAPPGWGCGVGVAPVSSPVLSPKHARGSR